MPCPGLIQTSLSCRSVEAARTEGTGSTRRPYSQGVYGIATECCVRQRNTPFLHLEDKLVRETSRREKPSRGRELQAESTPVRVSVLGNNPERKSDSSPDAVRSFSLRQRFPSEGQQDWADQLVNAATRTLATREPVPRSAGTAHDTGKRIPPDPKARSEL